MAALRSSGRYDRALVIVVADHGGSFVPGESYRAATVGNLPGVASIPFFLKEPGQRRGRIDDANVKSIDVLPTLGRPAGDPAALEARGAPGGPEGERWAGSSSNPRAGPTMFPSPSETSSAGATTS